MEGHKIKLLNQLAKDLARDKPSPSSVVLLTYFSKLVADDIALKSSEVQDCHCGANPAFKKPILVQRIKRDMRAD